MAYLFDSWHPIYVCRAKNLDEVKSMILAALNDAKAGKENVEPDSSQSESYDESCDFDDITREMPEDWTGWKNQPETENCDSDSDSKESDLVVKHETKPCFDSCSLRLSKGGRNETYSFLPSEIAVVRQEVHRINIEVYVPITELGDFMKDVSGAESVELTLLDGRERIFRTQGKRATATFSFTRSDAAYVSIQADIDVDVDNIKGKDNFEKFEKK